MKAPTRPFAFIMRQRSTQFIKLMIFDNLVGLFLCPIVVRVVGTVMVSVSNERTI